MAMTNEKCSENVEKFIRLLEGGQKDPLHLARKHANWFSESFLRDFHKCMGDSEGRDTQKAVKILRRLCRSIIMSEDHLQHFSAELFDVEKLKKQMKEKEKREQKKRAKEEKREKRKEAHTMKMAAVKKAGEPTKPKQVYSHAPKPKAKPARH